MDKSFNIATVRNGLNSYIDFKWILPQTTTCGLLIVRPIWHTLIPDLVADLRHQPVHPLQAIPFNHCLLLLLNLSFAIPHVFVPVRTALPVANVISRDNFWTTFKISVLVTGLMALACKITYEVFTRFSHNLDLEFSISNMPPEKKKSSHCHETKNSISI